MNFPVDLTFQMMSWRASVRITDAGGRVVGFVPGEGQKPGQVRIYADESQARLIYWIRSEHAFTQWFEDGDGKKLGEFGVVPTAAGKFVSVDGRRLFHFVDETPWLEFFEGLFPSLPIFNGLVGALMNPSIQALRVDGDHPVMRVVKKRLPIDISYSLHKQGEIEGRELECLVLSAIVRCLQDRYFSRS